MPDLVALAAVIDHTLLKPAILLGNIEQHCNEAKQHQFAAVCIPPMFVKQAKTFLAGSKVQLATVIGFPFGYEAIEAKLAEVLLALVDGADELDVVVNFTAIKNNDWPLVANEINYLVPPIQAKGKKVKVIIESGLLTDAEIVKCCNLYGAAGVDFMKTSTGFAPVNATLAAVKLMRAHLPHHVQIKASGGIRDAEFAFELMEAGQPELELAVVLP